MYTAHTSTLPFKDTRAFTLACTSDQFCSSWRQGPNHTPRMETGLSLQQKGLGRGSPPLLAPSCKPSLLSKLILAHAICLYLTTAFFMAFLSRWRDTKTVISSAYIDTFTKRGPAKRIPCRAGLAFSSLSLQSRGSKVRT